MKTDIPSYLVREGDQLSWKDADKTTDYYKDRTDGLPKKPVPAWLMLDTTDMSGRVMSMPGDDDLQKSIDSRLIVEFYSR